MKHKCGILSVLSLAVCAMIACMVVGGCGGSSGSSRTQSSRDQLIAAIGDIADSLQTIADSAFSNGKVINAIKDIAGQYLVLSADDTTLLNRAIGRTFMADDIMSRDITGNPSFDVAVYVKAWSNKHITVENGAVTSFVTGTSDFQLTITSSDNHVTKLTITPNSTTGYWQVFTAASALISRMFNARMGQMFGEHSYLILVYSYSSANIKVEYNGTVLLEGTLTLNFPTKTAVTPDTMGEAVFFNNSHTSKYNFTLHPQDNKDYNVKFNLDRSVQSNGSNSLSSTSSIKLYRQLASGTSQTILEANAGSDMTVQQGSSRPSSLSLKAFNLNIADKIRISESSPLDLVRLMTLYYTGGNDVPESTLQSNAAQLNNILSNAGLSFYLNKSTSKAGDIRAAVGEIQNVRHIRFGVQFPDSNEVEFIRDIANPDDLNQIKTLISTVSEQAQLLAQLLTNSGLLSNVTDNSIIKLIFEDLFGSN